jgi:hypothetical protein
MTRPLIDRYGRISAPIERIERIRRWFSTARRWQGGLGTTGVLRSAMTDSRVVLPHARNELFTAVIDLMWELYYEAPKQGVPWAAIDLLSAIGELDLGPWRDSETRFHVVGVPFTVRCGLLDAMLARLLEVTPGLGARVAIAKARDWLDPHHPSPSQGP